MKTGLDIIDKEHQILADMLHEIKLQQSKGEEPLTLSAVEILLDYVDYHFASEEAIMKKFNYFDYDRHASEHKEVLAKVSDYYFQIKSGLVEMNLTDFVDIIGQYVSTHMAVEIPLFTSHLHPDALLLSDILMNARSTQEMILNDLK
jgi:hemerythrin